MASSICRNKSNVVEWSGLCLLTLVLCASGMDGSSFEFFPVDLQPFFFFCVGLVEGGGTFFWGVEVA